MSTKLPEVGDLAESEEPEHQETRDRDAEKKQIGAHYVDKRHQAAEKLIQEEDLVLLEKKKENKLSPHCEKEPYQVTARYEDQVQLKSSQGVEYKRNTQHIERFVTPVAEPKEPSFEDPVVLPREQISGQDVDPSLEMGSSASPVENNSPIQEQPLPRRSERVTRPPDRFGDYVT